MIAVVDYGAANLLSITRALETCGASVVVTDDADVIRGARALVLPGVGAAGSALRNMRAKGTDRAIIDKAWAGAPLLGVCLGMQVLFESLAEDDATGLGLLAGSVPVLRGAPKLPHMGWNTLEWESGSAQPLLSGLASGSYVYFVHSFVCEPADTSLTFATTTYGRRLCAGVCARNLTGVQFHPEKSGATGLRMLRNWLATFQSGAPASETEAAPWHG